MEENLIRREYRSNALISRRDRNLASVREVLEEAWKDLAASDDEHNAFKNKCDALASLVDALKSQGEAVPEMLRDSDDIYLALWVGDRKPYWMGLTKGGWYIKIEVRDHGIFSKLTSRGFWAEDWYHVLSCKGGDKSVLILNGCHNDMQLRKISPENGSSYIFLKRIIDQIIETHRPLQSTPGAGTSTYAMFVNNGEESWD